MRAVAVVVLVFAVALSGADAMKRSDKMRLTAETSFTRAALKLKAMACTPKAVTCPDGSVPFTKANRPSTPNGCGASGSWLNDKILGGKFTPCCNQHDICYGAKGQAKNTCDTNFHTCMAGLCGTGASSVFCKTQAAAYFQAVSSFGCGPYENARINQGCVVLRNTAPTPAAGSAVAGVAAAVVAKVPVLEQALKAAAAAIAAEKTATTVLRAMQISADVDPSKICN